MKTWNSFDRAKDGSLTQNDFQLGLVDYGESITDKSKYNPNVSSFISNQGYIKNKALYDFPDGESNGIRMAILRAKNLDVTEKEALYLRLKHETEERLQELADYLKIEDIDELEKQTQVSSDPEPQTEVVQK